MHYSYEHKNQSRVGLKILFYSNDVMVKQQNYNKSNKIYERHTHTHHALPCDHHDTANKQDSRGFFSSSI